MTRIRIRVNGVVESLDIEPWVSLLDALRDHLGLTGPKKGCDQGACGACTVLADGVRINACLALAMQYADKEITTIEGIAKDREDTHPMQQAFVRHDGLQCGYCTSGQICSAVAMLAEHAAGMPSSVTSRQGGTHLTDDEIRERMSGNLCRCGAYNGILDAIKDVAAQEAP
ncbi:2Fe-2S iron-sulfur cluster-binding protein [Nonomuraea sp. NPDC049695]|uniref:(2Fe-2S)-binding protein n=1 Tax=Nonomuraea sp. NPDC049695 TaxID=3154734 RepID=UPI00341A0B88